MFFKDLSKYNASTSEVYNVGWLDINHTFDTGNFSISTFQKLISLEERLRTNQMRGTHECNLCINPSEGNYNILGKEMFLGSAELWIPNKDRTKIFAAPDLIIHYIYSHHYLPPIEFSNAIDDFDLTSDWISESIAFFR